MPSLLSKPTRQPQRKPKPEPEYFSLAEYTASLDPYVLQQRIDAESCLYRWVQVVLRYDQLPADCNYRLYEPIHRPMCERAEYVLPIKGREKSLTQRKLMDLEPRNSLKTRIDSVGAALYLLVFDYDARILISSHNHKASKEILEIIKWEIEFNPVFKMFYGDWKYYAEKFGSWAQDQFRLAFRTKSLREPTIDTCGAEISKTGGHYELIIVDDIQDRENSQTEGMRAQVRGRFQEYFPQLEPHGGMLVPATRYHRKDVYGWIMQRREAALKKAGEPGSKSYNEVKDWLFDVVVKRAWNPDGSLYYPTRLTSQFLEQQRIELEDYLFSVWYLNEPIDEAAKVFINPQARIREFDYYTGSIPFIELPSGERRSVFPTMSWDPKGREVTSKKTDYHGLIINGCDSIDTWWILYAAELRMPTDEMLEKIVMLALSYQVQTLSVETRGGHAQGLYIDMLRPFLERAGIGGLHIVEWKPGGVVGKDTLIRAMQPRFRRGGMFFRKHYADVVVQQLDDFPQLDNDDVLDALVQQKDIARPAELDETLQSIGASEGDFDAPEGTESPLSTARTGLGTADYTEMRRENYAEQRNPPNERPKPGRNPGDREGDASISGGRRWGWLTSRGAASDASAGRQDPGGGSDPRRPANHGSGW